MVVGSGFIPVRTPNRVTLWAKDTYAGMLMLNCGWDVFRLVIAVIILSAAAMKAWQLATVPAFGDGLLHAWWFSAGVVEFELAFGIWLLFGLLPRLTRFAAIILFTVFGGVSLYKALSGEASCGCFGAVQVSPWWTFILDATVVLVLCYCRKCPPDCWRISVKKLLSIFVLWVVVTVPVLYGVSSIKKNDLSTLGKEIIGINGHRTILLEPDKWANGKFPLLPFIEPADVRKQLEMGTWTVVLYHHDCPECQRVITELLSKGVPDVICVEIPPYGVKSSVPQGCVHARLSEKMEWIAETPTVHRRE